MKMIIPFFCIMLIAVQSNAQTATGSEDQLQSLARATTAIREAFGKGDAALVARLHAPTIEKHFGGNNVVIGREALQKGLTEWFRTSTIEFLENRIENTVFSGETAVQTSIFSMKVTPKDGGKPVINKGRAMVVFVRDKTSPTGWFSLREMTQAAPDTN
jgi:ketosteroid isomerase-like protein